MLPQRAVTVSIIWHLMLCVGLGLGDWLFSKDLFSPPRVMATQIVVKEGKKRPEDYLPRKARPAKKTQAPKAPNKPLENKPNIKEKEPENPHLKPLEKIKPVDAKKLADTESLLKDLSDTFSNELDAKEDVVEDESALDSTYFDTVYSLIKQSFVVPPHIDGPTGQKLQADLRLYIGRGGEILKMELERPSGDEHFDRAIMDGINRVNNFGPPPNELQANLSLRGIMVELCPFKCQTAN
jgi:outer membrane biosynthesis protein TonB